MVNRSATWADWDEELLTVELLDLQTSDFDLRLTGFDTKEIDDFLLKDIPDEDATPPLPVVPVTKPRDLWVCGSHRVLCGDATDAEMLRSSPRASSPKGGHFLGIRQKAPVLPTGGSRKGPKIRDP
jgi:hypothetical protein